MQLQFQQKTVPALTEQIESIENLLDCSLVPASEEDQLEGQDFGRLQQSHARRYKIFLTLLRAIKDPDFEPDIEFIQRCKNLITSLNSLEEFRDSYTLEDSNITLREDQQLVLDDLHNFLEGTNERGWLKLPMGYGKTIVASFLVRLIGLPSIVLVPRKALIKQTADKLAEVYPQGSIGYFFGERKKNLDADVLLSTYQSLPKLVETLKLSGLAKDFVLCDEAHRSLTPPVQGLLKEIPGQPIIIGATATPKFSTTRQVGNFFGELIHEMDLIEAIRLGILCGVRALVVETSTDLGGIGINDKGDFRSSDLSPRINTPERNQIALDLLSSSDIKGKRTLITCIDIKHAKDVVKQARKQKLRVQAVHSQMTKKQINDVFKKYTNGKLDALVTVDLITEGWDDPESEVLINLRPTMSPVLAEQRGGRVLRPFEFADREKFALVIDIVDKGGVRNGRRVQTMVDILRGSVSLVPDSATQKTREYAQKLQTDFELEKPLSTPNARLITNTAETLEILQGMDRVAFSVVSKELFHEIVSSRFPDRTDLARCRYSSFCERTFNHPEFQGKGKRLLSLLWKHLHPDAEFVQVSPDFYYNIREELFGISAKLQLDRRGRLNLLSDPTSEDFKNVMAEANLSGQHISWYAFARHKFTTTNFHGTGDQLVRSYHAKVLNQKVSNPNAGHYARFMKDLFGIEIHVPAPTNPAAPSKEIFRLLREKGLLDPERFKSISWTRFKQMQFRFENVMYSGDSLVKSYRRDVLQDQKQDLNRECFLKFVEHYVGPEARKNVEEQGPVSYRFTKEEVLEILKNRGIKSINHLPSIYRVFGNLRFQLENGTISGHRLIAESLTHSKAFETGPYLYVDRYMKFAEFCFGREAVMEWQDKRKQEWRERTINAGKIKPKPTWENFPLLFPPKDNRQEQTRPNRRTVDTVQTRAPALVSPSVSNPVESPLKEQFKAPTIAIRSKNEALNSFVRLIEDNRLLDAKTFFQGTYIVQGKVSSGSDIAKSVSHLIPGGVSGFWTPVGVEALAIALGAKPLEAAQIKEFFERGRKIKDLPVERIEKAIESARNTLASLPAEQRFPRLVTMVIDIPTFGAISGIELSEASRKLLAKDILEGDPFTLKRL